MTIPASQLVDITPRVIGGGLSGLAFVGTFITKSDKLPANTAVPFYSQKSIGDYFGTESDEYDLAQKYFAADSNSSTKPQVLWFYRKLDSAAAAWVRGQSKPATLDQLKAISAGTLNISIDGVLKELTGLDFSDETSFSGVAGVIQTALSGATCTWDSQFQSFVITSPTSGADSSVSLATGTVAELIGMAETSAATLSAGSASKSLTQTMNDCVQSNSNFYSFMPIYDETPSEQIELAEWCNSQGVRFFYALVDKTASGLTPNNPAAIANQVKDMYGVASLYNTKELGAMTMGFWASINPNNLEGRRTIAFRKGGINYTVSDETQAQTLLGNGYNFYGDYATASEQFRLYQNGQISGNAKWQDTYYGQVFIRDGLQNGWLTAMMNANTIPYNQAGYGILRAAAMATINTAVNAGFIRAGVKLDDAQKVQVNQEAGLDITGALETQGWYLQILDPTAQVRQERGTPIVNFWYCDGGSVQKIQGTSTVIL